MPTPSNRKDNIHIRPIADCKVTCLKLRCLRKYRQISSVKKQKRHICLNQTNIPKIERNIKEDNGGYSRILLFLIMKAPTGLGRSWDELRVTELIWIFRSVAIKDRIEEVSARKASIVCRSTEYMSGIIEDKDENSACNEWIGNWRNWQP